MSVKGFWYNGHYKRPFTSSDPSISDAYIHFYAFVVDDVAERPTVWQRVVMALQGWWWSDGKTPVAGDNAPT
jgi:hypothetical protein